MGLKASSIKHSCNECPEKSMATKQDEIEVVPDDNVTKTTREEAPAHYTLEIESFPWLLQILSKTGVDRYESTEFEAGGHKWRLILYPEGDKQRNGGSHISLYLRIVSPKNLGRTWEVDALLNFFVFDQSKNQYIRIQDGRVKRFNAVKEEWGFCQLLPLTEFHDTSKGYLSQEGSCKFGVEIFVLKSEEEKGECFTILDNPTKNYYNWKVENFPQLPESGHYSKEFPIGDYKWKLHLYPKGKVKKDFLSIFLCLQVQNDKSFPSGSKMYVEFKLRIINQLDENNFEKTGNAWFSTSDSTWGFPYFIKMADLGATEGLIVNHNVLVEAEISSMFMTKDLFSDYPKN